MDDIVFHARSPNEDSAHQTTHDCAHFRQYSSHFQNSFQHRTNSGSENLVAFRCHLEEDALEEEADRASVASDGPRPSYLQIIFKNNLMVIWRLLVDIILC